MIYLVTKSVDRGRVDYEVYRRGPAGVYALVHIQLGEGLFRPRVGQRTHEGRVAAADPEQAIINYQKYYSNQI